MKSTLYREQGWWHRAVEGFSPVMEFMLNETDPAIARESLRESVLNCELAKARAEVRVKLFQRNVLTALG